MTLIYTLHQIWTGGGFETLPTVDPRTGEYMVRSTPRILRANQIHEVDDQLAAAMIARGSARELTAQESALHGLAASNRGSAS